MAFLKITIVFTSGNPLILRHYDPDRATLLEIDAFDFTIAGILSQKFEDSKIYPGNFISRKLTDPKLNYDVYGQEMLAVVFSLNKNRHFLQGAENKTIIWWTTKSIYNGNQEYCLIEDKPAGQNNLSSIIFNCFIR